MIHWTSMIQILNHKNMKTNMITLLSHIHSIYSLTCQDEMRIFGGPWQPNGRMVASHASNIRSVEMTWRWGCRYCFNHSWNILKYTWFGSNPISIYFSVHLISGIRSLLCFMTVGDTGRFGPRRVVRQVMRQLFRWTLRLAGSQRQPKRLPSEVKIATFWIIIYNVHACGSICAASQFQPWVDIWNLLTDKSR